VRKRDQVRSEGPVSEVRTTGTCRSSTRASRRNTLNFVKTPFVVPPLGGL